MRKLLLILLLISLLVIPSALSINKVFRLNESDNLDVSIYDGNNNNFGASNFILGKTSGGTEARGLVFFNATSIENVTETSHAKVMLANLTMVVGASHCAFTGTNFTLVPFYVNIIWKEGIGDDENNAYSNGSTWTERFDGANWGSAGGDYNATNFSSESIVGEATRDKASWNITKAFKNWFEHDERENYGLILIPGSDTANNEKLTCPTSNSQAIYINVTYEEYGWKYKEKHHSSVNEFTTNIYTSNVTMGFDVNWINATFKYNNTWQPVTRTNGTNITFFSVSVVTPPTDIDQNISFLWNITTGFTNDTLQHKQFKYNQTISPLVLTKCSAGNSTHTVAVNFTFYDEQFPNITSGNVSFAGYFSFTSVNMSVAKNVTIATNDTQIKICSPNGLDLYVQSQIEYQANGSDRRNYYHFNSTFNNQTQETKLYSLKTTQASQITVKVETELTEGIQSVYMQIQRWYIGTNNFRTVAMGLTDSNGRDYIYLEPNDAWYKAILEKNGKVIYVSERFKITSSAIGFIVTGETVADNLEVIDGITYTLRNTTCSGIHCFETTFTDPSGSITQACLRVTRTSTNIFETTCDTCLASVSGTITCNIGNSSGLYTATLYSTLNGLDYTTALLVLEHLVKEYDIRDLIGKDGVWLTILIVGVLSFIGIHNPPVAIVLCIIGLGLSSVLGLFYLATGSFVGLIVVGLMIVVKMRSA